MTDVTLTANRTGRQSNPSARQLEILAFIVRHVDERGFPPTIREIGRRFGVESTSVVAFNLNRLAAFGLVARDTLISRGLSVTPAGRLAVAVDAAPIEGASA